MATRNFYQYLSQLALLAGLGSCTVYTPMQPTVSTVSQQGQLELTGSLQPNTRLEGTAVYSPLPHLLVTAAGSFQPKLAENTYATTRQWEAGLGSYVHLSPRWVLTGLAGYGAATAQKALAEFPIGGINTYHARYSKVFGQLSLAHERQAQSFGLVYRLANVRYGQLEYRFGSSPEVLAIPMQNAFRHEGLAFYRVSLDPRDRWQLQATAGLSVAQQPAPLVAPEGPGRNDYYAENREARKASRPVPMVSLGVVFRPQFGRDK
ncbi:hypothetical protein E5K00_11550 [Hymenobacter aquaticus]|uniref:Outer membrane protein beta-barrel domain-containing protein n=1 Tax=Hymenobacter aquaticus TaxID=1867101 RepID=A0A4Z0Q9R1_9BACT|nr:hypothetical protein [Hymenobacter aquaticus]TGE25791.1 hypothetical protein E5K00_11550 [Hymenobacter aquaticus]